jgi:hypothetical protein
MTDRGFRALVVLELVAVLASAAIGVTFPELLPESLSDAYRAVEGESFVEHSWGWMVALPLVLAALASYVGLLLFKPWGRSLGLLITVAGVALAPMSGPMVASWLESGLYDLANIAWGGILALAYYGPVSARFAANNPSKPTPLRGPA